MGHTLCFFTLYGVQGPEKYILLYVWYLSDLDSFTKSRKRKAVGLTCDIHIQHQIKHLINGIERNINENRS